MRVGVLRPLLHRPITVVLHAALRHPIEDARLPEPRKAGPRATARGPVLDLLGCCASAVRGRSPLPSSWSNQPFCKDWWRVDELRARPRATSYRTTLRGDQGTAHAAACR